MQRRQQRVRVRGDDGEGFDAFIFRQSPFIPQSGQLCAARACSRVCTVKAPYLPALMTKAFFRKCQNQMKEGRAAEAGGPFAKAVVRSVELIVQPDPAQLMSAFGGKADIGETWRNVRF
jgi:hypothetical protein